MIQSTDERIKLEELDEQTKEGELVRLSQWITDKLRNGFLNCFRDVFALLKKITGDAGLSFHSDERRKLGLTCNCFLNNISSLLENIRCTEDVNIKKSEIFDVYIFLMVYLTFSFVYKHKIEMSCFRSISLMRIGYRLNDLSFEEKDIYFIISQIEKLIIPQEGFFLL